MRLVVKYGGSSLADLDHIRQVADQVITHHARADQLVVVVSAMGKTTNQLLAQAQQLTPLPDPRSTDLLLSTGEQVSASYLAIELNRRQHPAVALSGGQAGILSVGEHQRGKIAAVDPQNVITALEQGLIVVVCGFQGCNEQGDVMTLGRGGSDTSAVALAAALGCACEIYTDVSGIYSVDPRLYPTSHKLAQLTYEETMEMADLGAKVIEPRSVELAQKHGVPLLIAHSFKAQAGTRIGAGLAMEKEAVTNISVVTDVAYIRLFSQGEHFDLLHFFNELAAGGINVDVISYSQHDLLMFTISRGDIHRLEAIFQREAIVNFSINPDVNKVSVIGDAMRHQSGVATQVFALLKRERIPFYQVSTSEISISYIIDEVNKLPLVTALAAYFHL